MPGNCVLRSAGKYAVKHNPAAYYVGADDRQACQRDDVPFDQFAADLAGPGESFPAFALITPDICNDMHDCSVATGDDWLRTNVEPILSSPLYKAGRTAVFLVFDESEGSGTMPFIAIAPSVAPGTVATATLDHFSLLRFTEEALGITEHLGRAASTPPISRHGYRVVSGQLVSGSAPERAQTRVPHPRSLGGGSREARPDGEGRSVRG